MGVELCSKCEKRLILVIGDRKVNICGDCKYQYITERSIECCNFCGRYSIVILTIEGRKIVSSICASCDKEQQ